MDLNNMRTFLRTALVVVGLVLVVGGGIAAVSPRTAALAANKAATLVADKTAIEFSTLPAIDAGIWVGREHKTPGQTGRPATTVARLDGRQLQLREEGFIASSRQESREAFRAWAHNAQILGILLLLTAGLTGRRRVPFRPNRAVTPVAPTPPATPVGPDPDLMVVDSPTEPAEPEKPAEPVQPVPTAVVTAPPPVDETGGDLDPAPQPEPPTEPTVEEPEVPAVLAGVAELTVRVTRTDGSTETVEIGGPKVVEANRIEVMVARTITLELDCRG